MNRNKLFAGALALVAAGASVVMAMHARKADVAEAPVAEVRHAASAPETTPPAAPAPVAPSPTPAPAPAPRAPGDFDMDAFLLENDLPKDTWEKYKGKSLEELTAMQAKMDERFQALKATTDEQAERRSQLLSDGRTEEADQVLADELAPAFEERRRIAAEAVLLARAKIDRRSEAFMQEAAKKRPSKT